MDTDEFKKLLAEKAGLPPDWDTDEGRERSAAMAQGPIIARAIFSVQLAKVLIETGVIRKADLVEGAKALAARDRYSDLLKVEIEAALDDMISALE